MNNIIYAHPEFSTYLPASDTLVVAELHNELPEEALLELLEAGREAVRITPTLTFVGLAPE